MHNPKNEIPRTEIILHRVILALLGVIALLVAILQQGVLGRILH